MLPVVRLRLSPAVLLDTDDAGSSCRSGGTCNAAAGGH